MSRDEKKQMAFVMKLLFEFMTNGEITDSDIKALENIMIDYPEASAEDFLNIEWIREWSEWKNGKENEWEIQCPMLNGRHVMTYYPEDGSRRYSYTAPFIDNNRDVCYYRFDHDKNCWDDTVYYAGKYNEGMQLSLNDLTLKERT